MLTFVVALGLTLWVGSQATALAHAGLQRLGNMRGTVTAASRPSMTPQAASERLRQESLHETIDTARLPSSPTGMSTSNEKVHGPRSYFPSIETKYGKSIEQWMALLPGAGATKHMELVKWLKTEYGVGHGHANALVAVFLNPDI